MTKRDAWRTLQTSILTRHEADKTRSTTEMGRPSLRRDGAPGRKVKGSTQSVIRGINQADGQTDRREGEGERNNKQRGLEGVDVEKAAGERKEGTKKGGGVKDG